MYWKVCQMKQLWANFRYSLSIYLVGLSKIFHAIQKFVITPSSSYCILFSARYV